MGVFELDSLFRTSVTVSLPGREVQVKALGDLQNRQRENMARSASQKYRKKLKDEGSEEYSLFIEPLADLTHAELVQFLSLAYQQLEAQDEARKQVKQVFVPEPDEATLDEKIDAKEQQSQADTDALKQFNDTVDQLVSAYRQQIDAWDDAKLVSEAKIQAVSFYSLSEYLRAYLLASVLLSSTVNGKRLFPDIESVDSANQVVVGQLYDAFKSVNDLGAWDLAKATLRGE